VGASIRVSLQVGSHEVGHVRSWDVYLIATNERILSAVSFLFSAFFSFSVGLLARHAARRMLNKRFLHARKTLAVVCLHSRRDDPREVDEEEYIYKSPPLIIFAGNTAFCLWQQPQHILFQLANFCFALSYSAPSSKKGILFMHSVLILGERLIFLAYGRNSYFDVKMHVVNLHSRLAMRLCC